MEARWRDWGARLRGLAQSGLYYGPEAGAADMARVREIGEDMEEDIPLRAWAEWELRAQTRRKSR